MNKKIKAMREGGRKLGRILEEVLGAVKERMQTAEINRLVEELILKAGGQPSFKLVDGYEWASCVCVNDGIVHCVPNEYSLRKGDLVTVDIGFYYKGYHTDTAASVVVERDDNKFLQVGRKALNKAIAAARPGRRVGDISSAMQKEIQGAGYNVVRKLVGHGIGKELHEEPQVPCYIDEKEEKIKESPILREGDTLAVEVIYMQGKQEVILDQTDNWTMRTKDGSPSAMFEHTIAVTNSSPIILTK